MHYRKPQAGAFVGGFGGEERLKNPLSRCCVHAVSVVGDGQPDVGTRTQFPMPRRLRRVQFSHQMSISMADAGDPYASTIMVGNYHNGPLSILLPFGIYGMIAFVWFLVASLRLLHRNWKFGNPALHTVNAMLFAAFASRAISFFLIFGSLNSDMVFFTGLLGLGVALNGAEPDRAQAEQQATGVEFRSEEQ